MFGRFVGKTQTFDFPVSPSITISLHPGMIYQLRNNCFLNLEHEVNDIGQPRALYRVIKRRMRDTETGMRLMEWNRELVTRTGWSTYRKEWSAVCYTDPP